MRQRNKAMQKEVIMSRLEREANQYRLNFLKSQMNPHFYFNTLNSINSYIITSDIKSANKFLSMFAHLIRNILENSQKEFITMEEEMLVLQKYVSLQQLLFMDVLEYNITAKEQAKSLPVPPMLVQPFVENSIEYAFSKMPVKEIIHVHFELADKKIICTITDNGFGIENSQRMRASLPHKSAAIKNIRQRIEMLNKIFNISIQLHLSELNPDDHNYPGTMVRLIIPVIKK
jgi:sensor histidine kinase YesM